MEPSDYGFSDQLIDLLRQWHAAWERVAGFGIGQPVDEPSQRDRAELRSIRRQAIAVIQREAPPDVQVKID